ncbi:MAG: hypothetical protein KKE83_03085, partial [Proteobacteria bacterium]|nr:hypothetical protein [Pseudomonadota bacterium]MBU1545797.1 hypothetical protein [Pseudomonadota bacterium]MBU2618650.1 hypothetical protein [Pseudomonadota bacterium]
AKNSRGIICLPDTMEHYKQFILSRRLVTEKKAPYFLAWVKRFVAFHGLSAESLPLVNEPKRIPGT